MTFWKKYGWKIILVLLITLLIMYCVFTTDNGFISTGENLEKEHWLGFCAGYLSFAGSLFLGAVALWQNEKANEMNKIINNLNERAILIDEEKSYPHLLAQSNRDEISKKEITYSLSTESLIIPSKSSGQKSTITIFKKIFIDENCDENFFEITIPIKLKNNSSTYIVYSKMISISGCFLPVFSPETKTFDELVYPDYYDEEFFFESLQPNQELTFNFVLQTNYSDIIKYLHESLNNITFKLDVYTLNHVCTQEITLHFGDNFTYKYHKLKEARNN